MDQQTVTSDFTMPYVICVMCINRRRTSQQNYEVYDSTHTIAALRAQNTPPKVLEYVD